MSSSVHPPRTTVRRAYRSPGCDGRGKTKCEDTHGQQTKSLFHNVPEKTMVAKLVI